MFPVQYKYDYSKHYKLRRNFTGTGLSGLTNLSNTCYFNSILQCLSHTLKLTDYLITDEYKNDVIYFRDSHKRMFVNNFVITLEKLWDHNNIVNTRSVFNTFGNLYTNYKNKSEQHDSHEFMVRLFDALHTSLSYPVSIEISGEVKTKTDKLTKRAFTTWSQFNKEYSIITELFTGLVLSTVSCNNCSYKDHTFTPFNTLNLNLPVSETQMSIYNLLDKICINETISDWKCEKCKGQGCTKTGFLWELPKYINFHFARFDHTGKKLSTPISFPQIDLQLQKYISPDKRDPNNYIYDLYAVNYHIGTSKRGHYYSLCKNPDGNWYKFNDENVSLFELDTPPFSDAYILFYQRKFIEL